jgi:hypothetical protein
VTAAQFRVVGCEALGFGHEYVGGDGRAHVASTIYDLLGDDMDGAAAMLEDAEMEGLL